MSRASGDQNGHFGGIVLRDIEDEVLHGPVTQDEVNYFQRGLKHEVLSLFLGSS